MTNEEILAEIERRANTLPRFTYTALHAGLPGDADRLADRYLQKLRRKGLATFERERGRPVWRLVDREPRP